MNKKQLFNTILIGVLVIWLAYAMQLLAVGFKGSLSFIVSSPLYFLYNCLFVLALLAVFTTIFSKNKYLPVLIVSALIVFLGAGCRIKLDFHGVGLTPGDLALLGEAANMSGILDTDYVVGNIITMLIVLGIAMLITYLLSFPRFTGKKRLAQAGIALALLLLTVAIPWLATSKNSHYLNARTAGVPYYFIAKAMPTKAQLVYAPHNQQALQTDIKQQIMPYVAAAQQPGQPEQQPDIIVIQCESFFDFTEQLGLENLSADPLPFYHQLQQEAASFYAYSPSYAGGTSNVEFETLTGISMASFPDGSNIYTSSINRPTISVASILRNQGYYCHAIHPYLAEFYSRQYVYRQLGFDRFDSIETMREADANFDQHAFSYEGSLYASDQELMRQITAALEQRPEANNFIFGVSVQIHIPFAGYANDACQITYTGSEYTASGTIDEINGYASNLKECDDALAYLINYLRGREKETIVVFYGDHQPTMKMFPYYEADQMQLNSERHLVPVLIWSNKEQLSAEQEYVDMTALAEQILYYGKAQMPNYLLALRQIRQTEQVDNLTSEYAIINGQYYPSNDAKYQQLRELYDLICADIFINGRYLEEGKSWLVEDNNSYRH